jgi:hypothetical protein
MVRISRYAKATAPAAMTVVIRSAARKRWIRDVKSASAEAMKNSSIPPLPESASMASSTRLMSVLLFPRCVSDGQSITRKPARVQYVRYFEYTIGFR